MTLVELIIAIVIINIGVVGVMMSFTSTVRSSVDPMIYKQMSAIADGMMEEILLKPFTATANAAPANSCARDTYNDVGDYNGYNPGKICDIGGVDIANLAGYAVAVSVASSANLGGIPAGDVRKIVIDVSRTMGPETYTLTGWRTCYAGPPC